MRIATRKSKLALWQANHVASLLKEKCEIVKLVTKGDKIKDVPLYAMGGKGFFVKEVDSAVSDARADIAVHSLKDMPAELDPGLILGAVPNRESPYEAWLSRFDSVRELPFQATVGTSSLRRTSEILRLRPDLKVEPLRGNVDTRVKRSKMYGGIIMAEAGLKRLGYDEFKRIRPETMIPAAGQGALGIVARKDDKETLVKLKRITHGPTMLEIGAERALIGKLEGGCQIPAGALARYRAGRINIRAFIGSLDGSRSIRGKRIGSVRTLAQARKLGNTLGERLLKAGGAQILEQVRS